MNRLRNKLILIFLAATLAPLAATVWVTTALLEYSLGLSATGDLETISRSLERTGRELYQHKCEDLKRDAEAGKVQPEKYAATTNLAWPEEVQSFADSDESERFVAAGPERDRLDYLVRHGDDVWVYSKDLGDVALGRMHNEIGHALAVVAYAKEHDLRRGLPLVFILSAACFWLLALALLIYLAHRISRPIQQLTAGLSDLAAGDLKARVPAGARDDEIGHAMDAFNRMADKLEESTERLVYLGKLASWQMLARKTAHEVKNSLTPIRLTVEEMLARYDDADRTFMEQATQIVVDEIETLERRVRAFSQFAAEPPLAAAPLDVNQVLEERVAFLKNAHPEVAYECRLSTVPAVVADQDMLKGILTNLLENAAEAAGEGGRILSLTAAENGRVAIEVHDSGPGLSEQARASLFQPTITFKKRGMGLGLSIARKSALLSGGDIVTVKGELGGAGFRVLLPVETNGIQTRPDRG